MKASSHKLNQKGVTIVETMMVVALIGLAMALLTKFTFIGVTAWQKQSARVKLLNEAQNFMSVLSYNLRQTNPGAVTITTAPGETQGSSMIVFTLASQSSPVSMFLKTTTVAGKVAQKQVLFSAPINLGATPTPTYLTGGGSYVVASDVASIYFTYPNSMDSSRVQASLTLYKTPFKNKEAVTVQTTEIINLRN